ncbi:MAG: class I SAM-dependent methyltransferase [Myxococcales bacterium]|nr:class I SAM-dependent methyltransferase [Myxococcales bacterium]HQY63441.1 class I SAM-dependent methyltransferase [Polyangiaceae bacterium]
MSDVTQKRSKTQGSNLSHFGPEYYERHYERAATRVHGPTEIGHLATMIMSYVAWLGGEVESVLDVGAGTGLMRDHFRAHYPSVHYRSLEVSPYAASKYGHELANIATFRARETFDLVICQGVLQYLDDAAAEAALERLGVLSRGFLYLEAITARDLRTVCDLERTDAQVFARPGSFYRARLRGAFRFVGCGLYYSKAGELRFYELERGPGA